MFNMKTGEPPASLVVLNDWIYAQHLPPLPKFHEKHPSVEMEGLDRKFYAQMRPLKFSERETPGRRQKQETTWCVGREGSRQGELKGSSALGGLARHTNWKITPVSVFNIQ